MMNERTRKAIKRFVEYHLNEAEHCARHQEVEKRGLERGTFWASVWHYNEFGRMIEMHKQAAAHWSEKLLN